MCIYAYMYADRYRERQRNMYADRYRERQRKTEEDRDGENLFMYRAKKI